MPKCELCKTKIPLLFLGKIKGTIIKKPGQSKPHYLCFTCQKKFKTKQEILKQLKL